MQPELRIVHVFLGAIKSSVLVLKGWYSQESGWEEQEKESGTWEYRELYILFKHPVSLCSVGAEPDGKERMMRPCSPQGQGLLWHTRGWLGVLSLLPSPALCQPSLQHRRCLRARLMQEETLPAEGPADRIIAPSPLKHSQKPAATLGPSSPTWKRDVSDSSASALNHLAAGC